MNFLPEAAMLDIMDQSSHMFHAIIGIDPLGSFSGIMGLGYEHSPLVYQELGRPHGPHKLSHGEGTGPGEVTLRWGMVIRTKLFDWIDEVRIGSDYRKDLFILQLSRRRLPIRLYHLAGAWPVAWTSSDMDTETSAAVASEEIRIAYDSMDLVNLSALSMAASVLSVLTRSRASEGVGQTELEGFASDYEGKASTDEEADDQTSEAGPAGGAVEALEGEYATGEQGPGTQFEDSETYDLRGYAQEYKGLAASARLEVESTYNTYKARAGTAVRTLKELKDEAQAWEGQVRSAEGRVSGGPS